MKTTIIYLSLFLISPLAIAEEGTHWVEVVDDFEYYDEPGFEKREPEEEQFYRYAIVCIKNKVPGVPSGTYFYKWKLSQSLGYWGAEKDWLFVNIALNQTVRHVYNMVAGSGKLPPFSIYYIANLKTNSKKMDQAYSLGLSKTNNPKVCPMKKNGNRFSPWGYEFVKSKSPDYRVLIGPKFLD